MMERMLARMICEAFEEKAGKWQSRKPEEERRGLHVSFHTRIDHTAEEGYRYLELMLYGPANYVGVWTRIKRCVIPIEHLEYDDEGDATIKPGHDYDEGASPWTCVSYHDSGWHGAVGDVIFEHRHDLVSFAGNGCVRTVTLGEISDRYALQMDVS